MDKKIIIRKKKDDDDNTLLEILNSFADSFAIYADESLDSSFVNGLTNNSRLFLVIELNNEVIGFGLIQSYKNFKNFNHTGVLTYFIKKNFIGLGYGSSLFNNLISEGKKKGITNYLAHISSYNNQSLSFHKKQGFEEVGRLKNVSFKFGKSVDVVWVQKDFSEILEKK